MFSMTMMTMLRKWMAKATAAKAYHSLPMAYFSSPMAMAPAAWFSRDWLKYRPQPTDMQKEPAARGLGMPRDSMMGNTITPMATTAPGP